MPVNPGLAAKWRTSKSRWLALAVVLTLLVLPSAAAAVSPPKVHTVSSGQRLGSIARRYSVSIEAICAANGIERRTPIKPGQKLLIPGRDDKDGTETRRLYGPAAGKAGASRPKTVASQDRSSSRLAKTDPYRPTTHTVQTGQRLASIAKRYRVSVEALCEANRIRARDRIKPGQVLVIPGSLPEGMSLPAEPSYQATRRVKRGYIDMSTYTTRYRGVVFEKNGRVSPKAVAAISRLFGAVGDHPRVDARLIALLADVSEHFGRPLRVVSGYREHSYYDDSRHRHSKAVDFSIPGVPNSVLRDYLRRFRNAGVGYYPNSSFVHLDVREGAAYWVDYAGPGEPPRSRPRSAPRNVLARTDEDAPKTRGTDGSDATDAAKANDRAAEQAGALAADVANALPVERDVDRMQGYNSY
jgi:LysM repeat protein